MEPFIYFSAGSVTGSTGSAGAGVNKSLALPQQQSIDILVSKNLEKPLAYTRQYFDFS